MISNTTDICKESLPLINIDSHLVKPDSSNSLPPVIPSVSKRSCPRFNILKQSSSSLKFESIVTGLEPYTEFDHLFNKRRGADPDRYWFLKSLPLNLEENERLCPKQSLISLMQAPIEEPVHSNLMIDHDMNILCEAIIQSQPISKSILKRNSLKQIKSTIPPLTSSISNETRSNNTGCGQIDSGASNVSSVKPSPESSSSTVTTSINKNTSVFRVSLASGGSTIPADS